MPENSSCDSSVVAAGKPKILDVLRHLSNSLWRASPGVQFKGERSDIVDKANRGKSCIELLDGRTNLQSHGKRSHEQILNTGSSNLEYGKHQQVDSFLMKKCLTPSGVVCSYIWGRGRSKEAGLLGTLAQYKKEEISRKMTSADIYSDPPATDVEDESGILEENNPKAGDMDGSLDRGIMSGHPIFDDFTMRNNDAKLQAKVANIKSLACVNFSSIRGEELLRFVCKLGRMCSAIGVDFNPEPVMLVSINSTDDVDIDDGLSIMRAFFNYIEMVEVKTVEVRTRFVLVILPDSRCSDERIEKVCRLTRLPCHCCLPLHTRMAHKEYLKNNADEIKIKVIGWKHEDTSKDRDASEDEMGGYVHDDTSEDEMGGYGYDYTSEDEMEGYGYSNKGIVSSHNELGEYTPEEERLESSHISCSLDTPEKRPDSSQISGSPDRQKSKKELLPVEGSASITTTIVDANAQTKSVSVESWACVNFSRTRTKDVLRFLCKIGDTCVSIGMDLTPEPTMVIHKKYTFHGKLASLYTVRKLFRYRGSDEGKKLLLVILPEDRFAKDAVVEACRSFGFLYQCCLPQRARMASEKYFNYAAKKIKAKVVGCYRLPYPDEDIRQDDELEEICGLLDEEIEEGSKQFDNSDVEMICEALWLPQSVWRT